MIPIKGTINSIFKPNSPPKLKGFEESNLPLQATANWSSSSTVRFEESLNSPTLQPNKNVNFSTLHSENFISLKNYKYIIDETEGIFENNGETILQKNIFIKDFFEKAKKENVNEEYDINSETSSNLSEKTIKVLKNLENGKNITVFLCLYLVDTSCYIENVSLNNLLITSPATKNGKLLTFNMKFPFAKYLLKNNNFPFFLFNKEHFTDSTNINLEFETECIKQLNNIVSNIHDLNLSKITDLYKGVYIVNDTNEEPSIYAFFDLSLLNCEKINVSSNLPLIQLRKGIQWATIDEIIYKKNINGLDINDDVIDLFNKENIFKTILSLEDQLFPTPIQLYLCKNNSTLLTNNPTEVSESVNSKSVFSFLTEKKEEIKLSNVLIGEPIEPFEHPILGYGYYFTSKPLPNTVDVNKLQRFSCFIINCFYMFNLFKSPLKVIDKEPSKVKNSFKPPKDYQSKTTNEDDISNFTSNLILQSTFSSTASEEENIKSTEIQQKKINILSEENNELLENILSSNSIYFNENGVQYWCIKNTSHFTKI